MGIIGSFFLKLIHPLVNFFFASLIQIFWGVVEFGLNLLDNITSLFEKLAFDNWSNVLFGTDINDGKIHLFPKSSSPLFYIWISMLSFGVLLLTIFLATYGIKKIKGSEGIIEENYIENRGGGVFLKAIVIALSFFFVPFMFITGMGLSSKVTKMLFPTKIKKNPEIVSNFRTNFKHILTESLQEIYEFPKKYATDFNNNQKGFIESYYSHSQKNGYKDTKYNSWIDEANKNKWPVQTFKNLNEVLERIEYEMIAFNKASIDRAPQEISDISLNIPTLIDLWKNKWGKTGAQNLKRILSELNSLTSNIKINNTVDNKKAEEVENLRKKLKDYSKDTTNLLTGLATFLSKEDNIAFIFNNNKATKLSITEGIIDPLILSKQTNSKNLIDTEAMISFYNINKIASQYIFSTIKGAYKDWNPKIGNQLPITKQENLEGYSKGLAIINSGLKIGDGKLVSLFDLKALYSGKKPLGLTTLIYQIASGNKGHDYSKTPTFGEVNKVTPRVFVGMMMLMTAIGLIGNLVSRVVLRIGKLGWLWIQAYVALPTSITDGGAKVRVWISMVVVELISIFALMGMWYIWKYMTEPIKNLIYSHGGDDVALGVVSFFAISALLGIIPQACEWLATIIGASSSFSNISSQMRSGGAGTVGRIAKTGFKTPKTMNKLLRGKFDGNGRTGGLLGKNGGIQGIAKGLKSVGNQYNASKGGWFKKVGRATTTPFRAIGRSVQNSFKGGIKGAMKK